MHPVTLIFAALAVGASTASAAPVVPAAHIALAATAADGDGTNEAGRPTARSGLVDTNEGADGDASFDEDAASGISGFDYGGAVDEEELQDEEELEAEAFQEDNAFGEEEAIDGEDVVDDEDALEEDANGEDAVDREEMYDDAVQEMRVSLASLLCLLFAAASIVVQASPTVSIAHSGAVLTRRSPQGGRRKVGSGSGSILGENTIAIRVIRGLSRPDGPDALSVTVKRPVTKVRLA
ncbi:hypothetical protein DFJ73DRAFT_772555 [Zopfochytrium polystomum]|nr:hypothetical protein DFJ73DRAFT_772555 [Zopfochytrium polystomum]